MTDGRERDDWPRFGAGVEKVMVRAQRPMTEAQVGAAVRANGDGQRVPVRSQLDALRSAGHIIAVGRQWGRPELFGRSPGRPG